MKQNVRKVLWENVTALMRLRYGKENLTRLAQDAKFGPGTSSRIKDQKTSVGIDVLESLAKTFDVEVWHLLVDGFDPENPPQLISEAEAEVFRQLKDVVKGTTTSTSLASMGRRPAFDPTASAHAAKKKAS